MKNVLIFGASGHGSVILDMLERSGTCTPVGFVDSFKKKGTKKNGYEVLGSEYDLPWLIDAHAITGGVVAIGDNWVRRQMVRRIRRIAPELEFITLVHPTATLGKDVRLGRGTVVMPGVIINANAVVGDQCILNTRSSLGHDGVMEDFSSLAPAVCAGGNLHLGHGAALSLGCNIIENIRIGAHSVVGAGSLVVDDIPDLVVAFGSPARIIRSREPSEPYLSGNRIENSVQLRLDYFGS